MFTYGSLGICPGAPASSWFDNSGVEGYVKGMPERRRLFAGIDCSSPWGGIALFDGFKVVGSVCMQGSRAHPFQPVYWIEKLLAALNASTEELAGIGVTVGPGMFTGLRVGLAVAKGLAFSLDLPLYPLTSLEAIALCLPVKGLLCPVLDARRGQFYLAIYRWVDGSLQPVTDIMLLPKERVQEVSGKVVFVGPGLSAAGVKGLDLPMPTAAAVARWAYQSQGAGETPADVASLAPVYLRPSDAEANRGIRVV